MEKKGVERYIGYLFRLAEHALRLDMDKSLAEQNLNAPQYAVLSLIAHYPDSSGADLARRFQVTAQTMAGIVAQLEARSLVKRKNHATHKRVLTVAITPEGQRRLRACESIAAAIEVRMLTDLSQAEERELRRLLEKCIAHLKPSGVGEKA